MYDHTSAAIQVIKIFLHCFSVYPCHLFLISAASVRSIWFLSFIMPILHEMFPWISNFLEEISSLPHLLFSSISLHCSLMKAFLSLTAILWNCAFRWVYLSFSLYPFTFLLYSAICKTSSENHFAFLHFFFLGMVLITVSCKMLHWAVCPSNLIPWIYLSLPLYNHKGFDLGHTWMS